MMSMIYQKKLNSRQYGEMKNREEKSRRDKKKEPEERRYRCAKI